jgi:hypothetical protein
MDPEDAAAGPTDVIDVTAVDAVPTDASDGSPTDSAPPPADGSSELLGRTSPLRRLIGVLGMLALVPTAWMLFKNEITVADAGQRAAVTYVAVRIALRLTGWAIGNVAKFLEKTDPG